jgi:hypothetical protein
VGLLHFLWDVIFVFIAISFLILLFQILFDIFRSPDLSGGAKAGWVLLVLIFPLIGALIYILARGQGMAQRAVKTQVEQAQHITAAAGLTPADQIAQGKKLLDDGAISSDEFEAIKKRVLS